MTKAEIEKRAYEYRLPVVTTPEELEIRWSKVLTFGDKVILAGYFYNGMDKPHYFGAAYRFLTGDHTCEGAIELTAASPTEFSDDGHAVQWAMNA